MSFEFIYTALIDTIDVCMGILVSFVNFYVHVTYDFFGNVLGSIFLVMSLGIIFLPILQLVIDGIYLFRNWFILKKKNRLLKKRKRRIKRLLPHVKFCRKCQVGFYLPDHAYNTCYYCGKKLAVFKMDNPKKTITKPCFPLPDNDLEQRELKGEFDAEKEADNFFK